ncbi:MAG: DUF5719 family protein [Actinomycetota bacterium]|nr:DUF5719 family protein [Actinomycetota bacterium]
MRKGKVFTIFVILALMTAMMIAPAWADVRVAQAPAIEYMVPPAAWPGTLVAIQGADFGVVQIPLVSGVTFNGADAGTATLWTDTYILVTVPEGATSGPVVVTSLGGSSNGYEFTVLEDPTAVSCYFAEGTTRSGFEEWLTLYNPWGEDLVATVTYLMDTAANRIRYYNVPAHTRVSVYVNSEIGSDRDVSITVTSTGQLIAERPMYFRYKKAWAGGHCTTPVLEPSTTWYFAEGTTRPGFEEWLCLANPGEEDATVDVTYIFGDGDAVTLSYNVPAYSRYTVDVNATVGIGADVALKLESSKPIVAERSMYFAYNWIWPGGHTTIGVNVPNTTWYFAEGTTRPGFEEWLCLANPGEEDAAVLVTCDLADGGTVTEGIEVPARRRRTIDVNAIVGAGADVALKLESSKPIVAERSMYFAYNWIWPGGHTTIGAASPQAEWYFAEGTTRSGFEEWLCLYNPGDLEARVSVNYAFQDGGTQMQDLVLMPGQRFSISMNQVVGPDKDVSVHVESDQGIVAERPMYFDYHGVWPGGHVTIGCTSFN